MIDSTDLFERLALIQEMALQHASEEMQAAHSHGLDTKEDRGDRGWLTKMSGQSLQVALLVERYKVFKETGYGGGHSEDEEAKARDAFVKRAELHLADIIKRNKQKSKHVK